ncbi:alpha/beta fold hydrolase [uncultured Corynebacterium sp.]|uniref:alpha/beta fold hydrolase n=1 Tax=uncultured Corynebacterium sp. TaxID=159447 RepID=UPI0025FEA81A|nr:alpha/beta fold hydrolase [uncultured Corynebacterium sp.]
MSINRTRSTSVGALGTIALLAASLLPGAATAGAQTGSSIPAGLDSASASASAEANDFYVPPTDLSDAPGTVIRREAVDLLVPLPNVDKPWPGKGERIMYTSTTEFGEPVAVTGLSLEPVAEWAGEGPRPTVVMAPGTIGQGDQCAPSRVATTLIGADPEIPSLFVNYELLFAQTLMRQGVRVVMTDYIGLGTPGTHTYMNKLDQAHAVLDASRAASEIAGEPTPVALWGYSQGGGAVAAAAETAPTYAPDVDIKGTYAGAPPADLTSVITTVQENLIIGALGYAMNGFIERYPESRAKLEALLNPAGRDFLASTETQCIADSILSYGVQGAVGPEPSRALTIDGETLAHHLLNNPDIKQYADRQLIGTSVPTTPVLVTNSVSDDTIPHEQARALAQRWCDAGADVTFRSDELPPTAPRFVLDHLAPGAIGYFAGEKWIMDRLNGVETSGCQM